MSWLNFFRGFLQFWQASAAGIRNDCSSVVKQATAYSANAPDSSIEWRMFCDCRLTRYLAGATEEIHETRAHIAGLRHNIRANLYLPITMQEPNIFYRSFR
jgi:hypothetical protein